MTGNEGTNGIGASDAVLWRVQKLLAQAEDAAATPAERETFNEKAAQLIASYGIDQVMLAATGSRVEDVTIRTIRMHAPYSRGKALLLEKVAVALHCDVVHTDTRRATQYTEVYGFPSDLERVELLYTSLLLQATRELTRTNCLGGAADLGAYRRSWLDGFAAAVGRRLRAAEQRAAEQYDQSAGAESTALVLASRQDRVDAAITADYPALKPRRTSQLSGDGRRAGYDAGERANLGTTDVGRHQVPGITR